MPDLQHLSGFSLGTLAFYVPWKGIRQLLQLKVNASLSIMWEAEKEINYFNTDQGRRKKRMVRREGREIGVEPRVQFSKSFYPGLND